MKRLMQRFLWMVLRSLWSPRKKQKVKMQMSRHTSDSRMPTHVITSRSRSCMLSSFCKRENGRRRHITHIHENKPIHESCYTGNTQARPPPSGRGAVWRWAFRAKAVCCGAQVRRLYPSASCKLAGGAVFNTAALWLIYCARRTHMGLPARFKMTCLEITPISSPRGRDWMLHNIQICEKEQKRRDLSHPRREKTFFTHHPRWLMDIQTISDYERKQCLVENEIKSAQT